jgi:hypothetical protein
MAKGLAYRYQGLDRQGKVKKTGNRLMDVEGMGIWLIVDYKAKRYAYQPMYPPTRQNWRNLTSAAKKEIADKLRGRK